MKNWIVKIVILMAVFGFVFTGWADKNAFSKNPVKGETTKGTVLDKTVKRTIMKVDKLTCGSCLAAINQKLNTFDGIIGLGADLRRGLVGVDHAKTLESKKIAEAITSIGYPAKILSVTEINYSESFAAEKTRR